jgi:Fuc2NAc and GlcNAc transferase
MVQGFGPITLGLTAASLAASTAGVWISIRMARRVGVLDIPNERSSHTVPTPRMGGVPMVAAAVLAFGCWAFLAAGEMFSLKGLPSSFLFAFMMSVLGFWDDLSPLSPLTRFLIQFFGAIMFLWAWTGLFPKVPIGSQILPQFLWILAGAVWVVWMLNLYNFMDGIDGLAGGEAAVAASFFFLLFAWHGESGWAVANLFVVAASMGFLVHNWPPARVFMGDAGSSFLGAFFGIQSVIAAITTPIPFPVLVLPFSNFILDTTFTLFRRMCRGEKWYLAHRSHIYQRMTNLGMSHKEVTIFELLSVVGTCIAAEGYLAFGSMGRAAVVVGVLACAAVCGLWVTDKERGLGIV